jgi:class 3 adenylate cyclase
VPITSALRKPLAASTASLQSTWGTGVFAYFGSPQAHEDDAERAVRAALAVVEAVRRVPTPELLQGRIGLATGAAVVGDLIGSGAAQEQAVIGDTPNLAGQALNSALCCFLFMPTPHALWTGQP